MTENVTVSCQGRFYSPADKTSLIFLVIPLVLVSSRTFQNVRLWVKTEQRKMCERK